MSEHAIKLCGVGKRYRRPSGAPRATTLKGLLVRDAWRRLWRTGAPLGLRPHAAVAAGAQPPEAPAHVWALHGLDLAFLRGRVTGVVGGNGAGKSTLLKLLGQIVRPDLGTLCVHGRVAALIELGAGFHPELTGRENVLINGVILGLSRAEVRERMDDIVAFAQLGEFIDFPVRTYSSGMYARLGFAVAIHVEPDILLVDEVLSVGDASFTARCRAALDAFRARGKSIVVVSHDLHTVATWCDDAVWLERGRLAGHGPAEATVQAYQSSLAG